MFCRLRTPVILATSVEVDAMAQYAMQRILLALPTLLLVSFAVYSIVRLLPGDAVDTFLAQNNLRYEGDRERLEKDLGLDKPIVTGYAEWTADAVRLDFGTSFTLRRPVQDLLLERLAPTITLGVLAVFFGVIVGVPVGLVAATGQDGPMDYGVRGFAILGLAIPNFWIATVVVIVLSKELGWSPAGKFVPLGVDPLASIRSLLIPAAILGLATAAALARFTRTQALEVLKQDYVRTARAKGLRERVVIMRHATRNALIPVVTVIGLQLPILIGGSVIMETIFSIPGIGSLTVSAINTRDYPVIQMINIVFALTVITANLATDLCYPILDPRIRP